MRSFWLGSAFSLALGFGISVFSYFTLTSSQAKNCQINGVPCSEMSTFDLISFCAMPAAVFLFIVLLGVRIKRHSPRTAAWLVSLPPAGLLIYASVKASAISLGG